MTLEKLGAGVDFVADTTPAASGAIDGDVYLDTSLSPPQVKVFDESVGSFVRPQTGVDWSSKTFNSDSAAAQITVQEQSTSTLFSISGSGFLFAAGFRVGENEPDKAVAKLDVDGSQKVRRDMGAAPSSGLGKSTGAKNENNVSFDISIDGLIRFESGFSMKMTNNRSSGDISARFEVEYALD
jgi:hypothetical protein